MENQPIKDNKPQQSEEDDILQINQLIISKSALKQILITKANIDLNVIFPTINQSNNSQTQSIGSIHINVLPSKLYPVITQCKSKQIKLNHDKLPTNNIINPQPHTLKLPQSICHIRFSNLQTLNLSQMNISSIQSLAFMIAPTLKCLQLYFNQLKSLQPLQKCHFPQLQVISFYENNITQIDNITRGSFKKLTRYELDNHQITSKCLQNYSFFFKMQNPIAKNIYLNNPNRISITKLGYYRVFTDMLTKMIIYVPQIRRRRMD